MIQLTIEEYAKLLWCAMHDDRRLPDAEKEMRKHWEEFPQAWRDRFNQRNTLVRLDPIGAEVRR